MCSVDCRATTETLLACSPAELTRHRSPYALLVCCQVSDGQSDAFEIWRISD